MTNPSFPSMLPTASSDEIDLGQLLNTLKRRRLLLGLTASVTLLLSGVITLLQKPVWEGEFQIVLANSEDKQGGDAAKLLAQNPGLGALVGVGGGQDNLQTEVKILGSPSVLRPVFDYVRQSKLAAGEDVDDLRFADWLKKNLEIKLEKGTAVLNLSYQDTDKALILPVLQRISGAYQAYSGRDRARGIAQGIRYLDVQIAKYRLRSLASLRVAQQFAIDQDLTALKDDTDKDIPNVFNLEAIRVQAANEIRSINEQLKQIARLGNDPEAIQFRGLMIPELAGKGLPQQIDSLNIQLASLRQTFTDNDPQIKNLSKRRRFLIDLFMNNTLQYLDAKRAAAQARLDAAQRPKGVLLRYRELLRVAARDEATLNKLEDERRVLALEQARQTDPWELISTPTLLDKPVSPEKAKNLALGLLAGLVLGAGAALVADRRTGQVFAPEELAQALPGPLLAQLDGADPATWQQPLSLLAAGSLAGVQHPALIPVGVPPEQIAPLAAALEQTIGTAVLCTADLLATRACDAQLLVVAPGTVTREQLQRLHQDLRLQGQPVAGWLLLSELPAADA